VCVCGWVCMCDCVYRADKVQNNWLQTTGFRHSRFVYRGPEVHQTRQKRPKYIKKCLQKRSTINPYVRDLHTRPLLFCSPVTVMSTVDVSRGMAKKSQEHEKRQNTSKGTYKRDLHNKPKWETDTQDLFIFVLVSRWFRPLFLQVRQTNAVHIKRGLRNKRHAHQKRPEYITGLKPWQVIECILMTWNTSQRHQIHPEYIKYILHTWNRS